MFITTLPNLFPTFVLAIISFVTMKLTLATNDLHAVSLLRKRMRRSSHNLTISVRHGKVFTQHLPRPVQPRTLLQQKSWSLLAEANRRVAADFANPQLRDKWCRLHSQQSLYKTARGLARAHYVSLLKSHVASIHNDKKRSCMAAAHTLRLNLPSATSLGQSSARKPLQHWSHSSMLSRHSGANEYYLSVYNYQLSVVNSVSSCFFHKNQLPSP